MAQKRQVDPQSKGIDREHIIVEKPMNVCPQQSPILDRVDGFIWVESMDSWLIDSSSVQSVNPWSVSSCGFWDFVKRCLM
jgi:hypothetical protein